MPKGPKRPSRRRPRADGNVVRVTYTVATALEICVRLANGEAWDRIYNTGRLPGRTELFRWRDNRPVFAEALAQAREIALERGGRLEAGDIDYLKGLLMTEKLPARKGAAGGRRHVRARKDGRIVPVRYGEAVAQEICERLGRGEPWYRIAGTKGLPTYNTLYCWMERYPEFGEAVRAARRAAADTRFEIALEVAAASTPATVQADKLHVATLLRHASQLDPERFGARSAGRAEGDGPRVQRTVLRRFERARREDGTEYVRVIDSVRDVETDR